MSASWTFRLARSADLPLLSPWLPQAELELGSCIDGHPDDQLYLAIAADCTRPAGCIRIRRNIGLELPRYWYHLGCVVHAAAELGLFQRERTLLLGNDLTGATELDFHVDRDQLDPMQLRELPGLLLREALARLRASAPETGSIRIIAALPGLTDAQGESPFWSGFGRHFYPGNPHQALARFGSLWLTHVAALLPRHPIVVSLLDHAAQAAIGAIAPQAQILADALLEAGLRPGQHLTLYDAGPVFEGTLDLLR